MQGDPKEGRLDGTPLLERSCELLLLEAVQARPQGDVGRRGVLSLQGAQTLDRARDGESAALQEHLPMEERPVQLAQREDALRSSVRLRDPSHL